LKQGAGFERYDILQKVTEVGRSLARLKLKFEGEALLNVTINRNLRVKLFGCTIL